jgi:hypothetical protein
LQRRWILRITRRLVGLSGSSDKTARTTKNPMFRKQHYDAIAKLIGQKVVYGVMDDKDYRIIEAFAQMFVEDNPTFESQIYRCSV